MVHQYTFIMDIINVITMSAGVIDSIKSFAIYESQLSNEVVKQAEELFLQKAREFGFNEEEEGMSENELLDSGWYESPNGSYPSVSIVWSDV